MAFYERYAILMSAEQQLFSPSCPVSVCRYQISGDAQTGSRLLQVRLLNLSTKPICAVYLRIVCLDESEQPLAVMRAVPMTDLCVPRAGLFGDERVIALYSARTVSAEISVERIRFSDGSSWNEPEVSDLLRLAPAVPVSPTDAMYEPLCAAACGAGVRNDFYFQQHGAYWRCTCGVANSNWSARCGYCGAQRDWLGANMDAAQLAQKAAVTCPPEPVVQARAQTAAPVEPVFVQTEPVAPAAPAYIPVAPLPPQYAAEEFPAVPDAQPRVRKKGKAGKVIATIAVIVVLLAAAGVFAYTFLMPLLRYRTAEKLANSGSYEQAIEIYSQLGDFSDSSDQIFYCRYQQGIALMKDADYEQAFEVFAALGAYGQSSTRAAECLYSQGVLAYNNGDVDTALTFAERLLSEYPQYDDTEELIQCCAYSKGSQALNDGDYEAARDWFSQAGDYGESQDGILECDYQSAQQIMLSGDYKAAVPLFEALGSYRDSAAQAQACMYAYAKKHLSTDDKSTVEYLQALADDEYEDSAKLLQELVGWSVKLTLNTSQTDTAALTEVDDLSKLQIHCTVTGGLPGSELKILLVYTLPDQTTGNVLLREAAFKSGDSVCIAWSSLKLATPKSYGDLQLKLYNADTGDELRTVGIKYTD